ncbi:hypothetical protein OSTOST_17319, partial [Ostertagia ostertagi]
MGALILVAKNGAVKMLEAKIETRMCIECGSGFLGGGAAEVCDTCSGVGGAMQMGVGLVCPLCSGLVLNHNAARVCTSCKNSSKTRGAKPPGDSSIFPPSTRGKRGKRGSKVNGIGKAPGTGRGRGRGRCARCRRCNIRVTSGTDLTREGLCTTCGSLKKCPKCSKHYNIGEKIIKCSACARWYHGTCEDLYNDEMLESASANKMRLLAHVRQNAANWL